MPRFRAVRGKFFASARPVEMALKYRPKGQRPKQWNRVPCHYVGGSDPLVATRAKCCFGLCSHGISNFHFDFHDRSLCSHQSVVPMRQFDAIKVVFSMLKFSEATVRSQP
jgi:hypothetical protein